LPKKFKYSKNKLKNKKINKQEDIMKLFLIFIATTIIAAIIMIILSTIFEFYLVSLIMLAIPTAMIIISAVSEKKRKKEIWKKIFTIKVKKPANTPYFLIPRRKQEFVKGY